MKLTLVTLLLWSIQICYAQNNGNLQGHIVDRDHKPLQKATVSIMNQQDSMLITYSLTDEKGKFEFIKLPTNKKIILFISHINAKSYQQEFVLNTNEKRNLETLELGENRLDEVQIDFVPPVRMNKDTLEYNANFLKPDQTLMLKSY